MIKSIKIRAYPNEEQKIKLAQSFGSSRWLWNNFLNLSIQNYEKEKTSFSRFKLQALIPNLKKEKTWLKQPHSQSLQMVVKNLDTAFQNFFGKRANFPKFKSKHHQQSIQFPQSVKLNNDKVFIPKIGWIKAKVHRKLPENIKINLTTVKKTAAGKYFISITYDDYKPIPVPSVGGTGIGLDMSFHDYVVDSNGKKYGHPKWINKSKKNLKKKQKSLSRKTKGTNSRSKARLLVAKAQEKTANQRKDYLHKLSRNIVDENQVICIETLSMKGMSRKSKKSKRKRFGKSVSDMGWFMFTTMLEYKALWYGKELVKIDRWFPSTKTCHYCGHVLDGKLDVNIRSWVCPSCHAEHDRDINAAKNILKEGYRIISSGTGETASGVSRPQSEVLLPLVTAA